MFPLFPESLFPKEVHLLLLGISHSGYLGHMGFIVFLCTPPHTYLTVNSVKGFCLIYSVPSMQVLEHCWDIVVLLKYLLNGLNT
jgi:hypothetical protein